MPVITDISLEPDILVNLSAQNLSTVTKDGVTNVISLLEDTEINGRDIALHAGSPTHGTELYNGRPVISFAVADEMRSATGLTNIARPSTSYILGGFKSNRDNSYLKRGNWTGHQSLRRSSGGTNIVDSNGGSLSGVTPLSAALHVIVAKADGTTDYYADGALIFSGDAGSSGPGDALRVGSGADIWFGQLLEFDTAHDDAKRLDISNYITEAWKDLSTKVQVLPPTGWGAVKLTELGNTVPPGSIVTGGTYAINDYLAYELEAVHDVSGAKGVVSVNSLGMHTITGPQSAGNWTYKFKLQDANGESSPEYTATQPV